MILAFCFFDEDCYSKISYCHSVKKLRWECDYFEQEIRFNEFLLSVAILQEGE